MTSHTTAPLIRILPMRISIYHNCMGIFWTEGMGKPEPLRHALAGYWSRRITDEHRMVYKPTGNDLLIAQLRYHY